jgi:hypothetical protein
VPGSFAAFESTPVWIASCAPLADDLLGPELGSRVVFRDWIDGSGGTSGL